MLGRLAAGMTVAAMDRKPSPPPHNRSGGPVAAFGIALCVGILIIGNITHEWTWVWLLVLPLICSAFIAAGWIIQNARRERAIDTVISSIPEPPRVTTVSEMRQRAADLIRLKRVTSLLQDTCPVCESAAGTVCKITAMPVTYQLDPQRLLYAHGARIGAAMKAGKASAEDVTAQFNGQVPDDVWEAAL